MPKKGAIPWLTLALISANLGFAFALWLDPSIADSLGFSSHHPAIGDAFFSMFLHLNIFHLLGNMVFLAAVGPLVEYSSGWLKLAVVYIAGGIAGVLAFWLIARSLPTEQVLIGASGAIAGCVGFCSVRYMRLNVPIFPKLGVGVWKIAVIWATLQIFGAIFRLGDDTSGVSFWAHLGGFLVGLLLTPLLGATKQMKLEFGHEVLEQMNERGPSAALHAAEKHLQAHPGDIKAITQKALALRDLGEGEKEAEAWLELIQHGSKSEKSNAIRELNKCGGITRISPSERARIAEEWKSSSPEVCEMLLESLVNTPDGDPFRPDAILSLAQLLAQSNPEKSKALLEELDRKYAMHGAASVARARGLL